MTSFKYFFRFLSLNSVQTIMCKVTFLLISYIAQMLQFCKQYSKVINGKCMKKRYGLLLYLIENNYSQYCVLPNFMSTSCSQIHFRSGTFKNVLQQDQDIDQHVSYFPFFLFLIKKFCICLFIYFTLCLQFVYFPSLLSYKSFYPLLFAPSIHSSFIWKGQQNMAHKKICQCSSPLKQTERKKNT